MRSGKQGYIKWSLWGLFIALNVIPLFFPNESIMWTLRSAGYQIDGLEINGLSEVKIARFVDDTSERFIKIEDFHLRGSKEDEQITLSISIKHIQFKDRHLPNYKFHQFLTGLANINDLAMGPGLKISAFTLGKVSIEFSESSAPFAIDQLIANDVSGENGQVYVGNLKIDGPNLSIQENKLIIDADPEQFADLQRPQQIQTKLTLQPLALDLTPLTTPLQN